MKNFSERIKFIFVPFLITSLGFTLVYSFLNWLLIITLEVPINEEVINFWLVFALPWIPILIWIRPRIRLLALKTKKGDLPGLYLVVAAFAIIIPALLTQLYLVTATGKITSLSNASEIPKHPLTKYYQLKDHFIDKRHTGVFRRALTGGKNNEYLTFDIDLALPIFSQQNLYDTAAIPKVWLGYEFSKTISSRLSDQEKEQEYKAFAAAAGSEFNEKNFDEFVYLDRIGVNDKRTAYLKAIKSKLPNVNKTIILEAVNEPFEQRNGDKLKWIILSFIIGTSIWFIMLIIPKINMAELKKRQEDPQSSDWGKFYKYVISFRLGNSNMPVTLVIIGLNILVFLLMVFAGWGVISFDARDLLAWGANFRPKTTDGQWWRLVTNIFMHGGLMHILGNIYGLFIAGILLEPMLGKVKYASAYLMCGIVASLASIWWHPATISIGASGAIFGLYGILTVLLTTNKVDVKNKKGMLLICLPFIVINLLIGLTGGIDNAAHIGGLISGLIFGYLFFFFGNLPHSKIKKRERPVPTNSVLGENE